MRSDLPITNITKIKQKNYIQLLSSISIYDRDYILVRVNHQEKPNIQEEVHTVSEDEA